MCGLFTCAQRSLQTCSDPAWHVGLQAKRHKQNLRGFHGTCGCQMATRSADVREFMFERDMHAHHATTASMHGKGCMLQREGPGHITMFFGLSSPVFYKDRAQRTTVCSRPCVTCLLLSEELSRIRLNTTSSIYPLLSTTLRAYCVRKLMQVGVIMQALPCTDVNAASSS